MRSVADVITIGFKEFASKLNGLPKDILDSVDGECQDAALLWVQLAQNSAAVDTGRMRGNITSREIAFLNYEVTSPILYSPYVEWGTITRVAVPSDLQAYALQFKGKGIRKTGGNFPQPFFFIHRVEVEGFLIKNAERVIGERLR